MTLSFNWLVLSVGIAGLGLGCMGKSSQRQGGNLPERGSSDYSNTRQGPLESGGTVRRVRRLSNREYNNVVRDLLGDLSRPASAFLDDSFANGFDNGSALLTVQMDQALRYQEAAERLAERAVTTRLPQLLGGCAPTNLDAGSRDATCFEKFLDTFVPRAFRRPPTQLELGRLRALYATIYASQGFRTAIQVVLEAVLQSPAFLYREELGTSQDGSAKLKLTGFELASELSFFIIGSMPDDELFTAASEGRLQTSEDLKREASRLLQTMAARNNLREFFRQWLSLNRLSGLTKDPQAYPTFNSNLAASMEREMDLFIDDVLWNRSGTLREMFTSRTLFPDQNLGALYGIAGASAFRPVQMDSNLRQGVMTRAGYLAVHSGTNSSSPVERGVFVRQALLCTRLPPPPPDVLQQAMMHPVDPTQTTRERHNEHSTDPFCQSCHRLIDPLGFGFEEFDGIGVFRDTENGHPVDTSGAILGTDDVDGPFVGVSELGDRLVGSRQFQQCSVTQLFRFAMGQGESSADARAIYSIAERFTVDQSMLDLLSTFVSSPLFTERLPENN